MKAEINNLNKVKFFAQYWGQKVFVNPILSIEPVINYYLFDHDYPEDIDQEYLLLKPLSQINDEDMKGVANLVGLDDELDSDWNENIQELIDHIQGDDAFLMLGDFFRSKGYALPWLGLSVEEMVEAGWIKLSES